MNITSKKIPTIMLCAVTLIGVLIATSLVGEDEKEIPLKSHLTIYVGEPLLSHGGTVIVGSVPMPVDEWQNLEGFNLAAEDDANAKRGELNEQDRLFGAYVFGPVSYIEMYYPEGGTFGFNLAPDVRLENPKRITSERILVGSGGWFDRENNTKRDWSDVSVIHINGPSSKESNSRLARVYGNDILNFGTDQQDFAGAIVNTPSDQQLIQGTSGAYK